MKRVVITGLGVVSPLGCEREEFFTNLLEGRSGVEQITSFDCSGLRSNLGGIVKGFEPGRYLTPEEQIKTGLSAQYAIAATAQALEQSGLLQNGVAPRDIGVSLGTTMGEAQVTYQIDQVAALKGIDQVPGQLYLQRPPGAMATSLARKFGFGGPNNMIPTACAAGNYAIGNSFDLIQSGRVKAMVTGGADCLSISAVYGFNRLNSLTPDQVRPFDRNRKGILVGEGAGILVLEEYEQALARGAKIIAEVLGYGISCSTYHMITPDPQARGAVSAINKALQRAGVDKNHIGYISAHGTGTLANDKAETKAIKQVFGDRAGEIPISSIKSMLGHMMGAASAVEALTCALVVQRQLVPPTINYQDPDPECDLDYVPNYARKAEVDYALSNAYAFGANDSTVLIGKFQERRQ